MTRAIRELYEILTSHYVEAALAWVGIFYLLITVGYWLRNRHVHSEEEKRKSQEIYVDQLNCLGVVAAGTALFVLSVLVVAVLGVVLGFILERNGLHPGFACLAPFILIALIILFRNLKQRLG